MFTALITLLGSAGARLFIGQLFDFVTKWQDQRNELQRLKLQGELDAAQHARNLEAQRLQADLGIKVIEAQTVAAVNEAEAAAFVEAVKATGKATGVRFIDGWNGAIRPTLASVAIVLWMVSLAQRGFALDDWDRAIMGSVLGLFIGGRIAKTGR